MLEQLRSSGLALLEAGALTADICGIGEAETRRADTALVLAVDASESVTAERYSLQMHGIAAAFRERLLQEAILGGPHKAILVVLIEWSSTSFVSIPWTYIGSREDADAFADMAAAVPRTDARSKFTCLAVALRAIEQDVLPLLPIPVDRLIIDISGDGTDNCGGDSSVDDARDGLVAAGVTINGLPILEGDEAWRLKDWYSQHVVGGRSAVLVPADDYHDVQRALLQKFLTEISTAKVRPGMLLERP